MHREKGYNIFFNNKVNHTEVYYKKYIFNIHHFNWI